jgi:hypothetical protein
LSVLNIRFQEREEQEIIRINLEKTKLKEIQEESQAQIQDLIQQTKKLTDRQNKIRENRSLAIKR